METKQASFGSRLATNAARLDGTMYLLDRLFQTCPWQLDCEPEPVSISRPSACAGSGAHLNDIDLQCKWFLVAECTIASLPCGAGSSGGLCSCVSILLAMLLSVRQRKVYHDGRQVWEEALEGRYIDHSEKLDHSSRGGARLWMGMHRRVFKDNCRTKRGNRWGK